MSGSEPQQEVDEIVRQSPAGRRAFPWREITSAAIAYLNGFVVGIAAGFVSPTLSAMKAEGILQNEDQVSWWGSTITLGVAAGGPTSMFLIDKLGRKTTILISYIPHALGWLCISSASGIGLLIAGRLLIGIACGVGIVSVNIYLAEIASNRYRGCLVLGFNALLNVGILFSLSAGFFIPWRYFSMLGSVLTALAAVMTAAVMEESPRWLMMNNNPRRAQWALQRLRGRSTDIMAEFSAMQISKDNKPASITFSLLKSPNIYKPGLIALLVLMANQASGAPAIIAFLSDIFRNAGWTGNAILPSALGGLAPVIGVFVSAVLVDRTGRRRLMIITGVMLVVSCTCLGLASYLQEVQGMMSIGWLSLSALFLYLITFSSGTQPASVIIASEILPPSVRGAFTGAINCITWLVAFAMTEGFPEISTALGQYTAFWILAGVNLIPTVLILAFVPETRGKSLEEIEEMFKEPTTYDNMARE